MARAFPVPVYTTLTSSPSPFTANKRALSNTSPGSTDNTATGCNGGVSGVHGFFRPAANITMTTGSGTTPPAPVTIDDMWILPINPTLAPTDVAVGIEAGTWTIPIHYSRPGGVLTADVPGTLWAILVRVDSTATTLLSEIGRSAANNVTATTTEQSVSVNITGVATEFAAGDCLGLLIYFDRAGALTSDTFRIHTNSTTGTRITAAPNYSRRYTAALADSQSASDALVRTVGYGRTLSDTPAVSDALTRQVSRERALNDSPAAMTDTLVRQVSSSRAIDDTMAAASDTLSRSVTLSRNLDDSAAVTEDLGRQVGYARALQDDLATGTGGTIVKKVIRPTYVL